MKRLVNGQEVELAAPEGVEIVPLEDRFVVKSPEGAFSALAVQVGDVVHVSYRGHVYKIEKATHAAKAHSAAASGEMRAPMPGQIVDVIATEGAQVKKGDKILVLEAMKTQQAFNAPFDGVVKQLRAEKGKQVAEGELLALVEESSGR